MSVQNARGFLEYVLNTPELAEKFKGFNLEELRQAIEELNKSLEQEGQPENLSVRPILPI